MLRVGECEVVKKGIYPIFAEDREHFFCFDEESADEIDLFFEEFSLMFFGSGFFY